MHQICIDTGILTLYFSKNCPSTVQTLMDQVKEKKIKLNIIKAVLSETFYHVCKIEGKEAATLKITGFLSKYTPNLIELSEQLLYSVGILKCQHASNLSYIDCMSIAFSIQEKVEFHTTEKNLARIPHNTLQKLKIVKYKF